jgi:hypothetical protein
MAPINVAAGTIAGCFAAATGNLARLTQHFDAKEAPRIDKALKIFELMDLEVVDSRFQPNESVLPLCAG